jgi:hypothetical protein
VRGKKMKNVTRFCALAIAFLVALLVGGVSHAGNPAKVFKSEFSGEVENCGIDVWGQ